MGSAGNGGRALVDVRAMDHGRVTSMRVACDGEAEADALAFMADCSGVAERVGPVVQSVTGHWTFSVECPSAAADALAFLLGA